MSATVTEVARKLASELESLGQEYALGGALALGFWGEPRGTLDVDLTLFMPRDQPNQCVFFLQDLGCAVNIAEATQLLREYGMCRVQFEGVRVDVFLPGIPFYEIARQRRQRVPLGDLDVWVWDAGSLIVFKMMFFRRKDLADVGRILQAQGAKLDRSWIRRQILEMYGARDPRVTQWDELVAETTAEDERTSNEGEPSE
jgi:hypothetical protein